MTVKTQLKDTDSVFGFYLKPQLWRRSRRVTPEAIDLKRSASAANKLNIRAAPLVVSSHITQVLAATNVDNAPVKHKVQCGCI